MARANVGDFAVAVLDFSLGSETASPVAHRLVRRGVPFVLCTGQSGRDPRSDRMGFARSSRSQPRRTRWCPP